MDRTAGVCSCAVGKDGSPCKHQHVLWAAKKAHCPNFISVTDSVERQKLAKIAIGETLPLSFYSNLRTASCMGTQTTTEAPAVAHADDDFELCTETRDIEGQACEGQEAHIETDPAVESASNLLHKSFEQITQKLHSTNDTNLARAIIKFSKRVTSLTGPTTMQSNLIAALHNLGTNELQKTGSGKKIRVQPNRKRACGNGSRQAVSKGRPTKLQETKPSLEVPHKRQKRTHNLANAVQANTNTSKKSGSHVMKSKTRHVQRNERHTLI